MSESLTSVSKTQGQTLKSIHIYIFVTIHKNLFLQYLIWDTNTEYQVIQYT